MLDSTQVEATTLQRKIAAAITRRDATSVDAVTDTKTQKSLEAIERSSRAREELEEYQRRREPAPSAPPPRPSPRRTDDDIGSFARTETPSPAACAAPQKRPPTLRWVVIALVVVALVLALLLAT